MNRFLLTAAFAVAALTSAVQAKGNLQDEAIPVTGGYMNGYGWLDTRPPTVGPSNPSQDFYSSNMPCPKEQVCDSKNFWLYHNRMTYLQGLLDGGHYNEIDCGHGGGINKIWKIAGAIWDSNIVNLMERIDQVYRDPKNLKLPVVRVLDYIENEAKWGAGDPALKTYLDSQRARAQEQYQAEAAKWR